MKTLALATASLLALSLGAGCEKKKAEEAAQKVGEAAKAVGETIAEGAKKAGQTIATGAKAAWETTKEGAKYVGEKIAAGAKVVGEKVSEGAKVVAKEAKDSWITTKIKAKVGIEKLFAVSVTTHEGKVTLTGRVKTQAEKDAIDKAAKETDGVVSVVNNIEVKP
jgi:osmotically-inducible protein OsmY